MTTIRPFNLTIECFCNLRTLRSCFEVGTFSLFAIAHHRKSLNPQVNPDALVFGIDLNRLDFDNKAEKVAISAVLYHCYRARL